MVIFACLGGETYLVVGGELGRVSGSIGSFLAVLI